MWLVKFTATAAVLLAVGAAQTFAASPVSSGAGNSDTNAGSGGRSNSAAAGSQSGFDGPNSPQDQGIGLQRLLATGSGGPTPNDGGLPPAVATGAPLELLPPQAVGPSGAPVPRMSPVTVWAMLMADGDTTPGYWRSLIGAGNSLNASENADPADSSRIKRIARYFEANATAEAAAAALKVIVDFYGLDLPVYTYQEAVDAALDLGLDDTAQATVDAYEADPTPPGAGSEEYQDYVDARNYLYALAVIADHEAEAAALAAFTEADNRPYDETRRDAYDDLAAFLESFS